MPDSVTEGRVPGAAYRAVPSGPVLGGLIFLGDPRLVPHPETEIADRLARCGYVVLAPDVAELLAAQGQSVEGWDGDPFLTAAVVRSLRGLIDELAGVTGVHRRVAAVGTGIGGVLAYDLAGGDPRVRLTLAFDATPTDVDVAENITGTVAGFYGDADPEIRGVLPELRAAMRRAGVTFAAKTYPGARRTFFDSYAERAVANDSFARSVALLACDLV